MTMEDLANYTTLSRKPSQITYRGYRITSGSAPSSGEVALSIMKTLEGYNDIGHPETLNISTHRVDEAMRWSYGMVCITVPVSYTHLTLPTKRIV